MRRKTREIKIGKVKIGGNNPIAIQSMAKTRTADISATVRQIQGLEACGCEIIRVAVKDISDARAIARIKKEISIPLVADIHFDWRLALAAIENKADKVRLNPGNIHKKEQLREVVAAARASRIPIRVGLNSGSVGVNRDQVKAMVAKARGYLKLIEGWKFRDLVVSLKAQNVRDTVAAYRKMAGYCDYPFHLGVTATGLPRQGQIKSSLAIGALLLEGIGDTIRVSLTDDPCEEVRAAKAILQALELRDFGVEVISCPTCGRCEVDLVRMVRELEAKLAAFSVSRKPSAKTLKVAVMGCVVNGPGEARLADLGIAFGRKEGLLFKKGKPVKKVPADRCVSVLIEEISNLAKSKIQIKASGKCTGLNLSSRH